VSVNTASVDGYTSAHPLPADGTVLQGLTSRLYYVFQAGCLSPSGSIAGAVSVPDADLSGLPQCPTPTHVSTGKLVVTVSRHGRRVTGEFICAGSSVHSTLKKGKTSARRCRRTSHGVATLTDTATGRWHVFYVHGKNRVAYSRMVRVRSGRETTVLWNQKTV
jgi:hypothetical protein